MNLELSKKYVVDVFMKENFFLFFGIGRCGFALRQIVVISDLSIFRKYSFEWVKNILVAKEPKNFLERNEGQVGLKIMILKSFETLLFWI